MKKAIGFYFLKSITQACLLFMVGLVIFPEPYRELSGYAFLMLLSMGALLGLIVVILEHFIFKITFPNRFEEYKVWAKRNGNFWQHKAITLAGYSSLAFLAINCFNQYNVNTPIQLVKFSVTAKVKYPLNINSRTRDVYYHVLFKSPMYGHFMIDSQRCFEILKVGDTATLSIQKGRLHTLFVRDLTLDDPYKNIKC